MVNAGYLDFITSTESFGLVVCFSLILALLTCIIATRMPVPKMTAMR